MATKSDSGFSEAERKAMKERAAELRNEQKPAKGSAKKEREAQACLDAIDALTGTDQKVARALHSIVSDVAPELDPKTWYGFPTYARDGKVVIFYQPGSKFDTRYGTVNFSEETALDDGEIWPVSFAVIEVTDAVEKKLRTLVKKAVG